MQNLSDPRPFAYCDPHMHTAIWEITHMGIQDLISHMETFPLCIHRVHTGISVMWYPYANGNLHDPRMHTGIMCHVNPCIHMGIFDTPICIHRDWSRSAYAYRDSMTHNPRMHKGISSIPVRIRQLILIPVCIRESQGVIGSHHGESPSLFLVDKKIIMSTTNK